MYIETESTPRASCRVGSAPLRLRRCALNSNCLKAPHILLSAVQRHPPSFTHFSDQLPLHPVMSAASTETSEGSRVLFKGAPGVGWMEAGPINGGDPDPKKQGKVTVKYDRKELRKRLALEEWIIDHLIALYDCGVSRGAVSGRFLHQQITCKDARSRKDWFLLIIALVIRNLPFERCEILMNP